MTTPAEPRLPDGVPVTRVRSAGGDEARVRTPSSSCARRRALDGVGALLVVVAVGTIYAAAGASGGRARPEAALLVGAAAALMIGRAIGRVSRPVVPALVVLAALALAVSSRRDLFSKAPLSGPFGYDNAKGSFFALAAVAGLMLVAGSRGRLMKAFGVAAALGFGAVPVASSSVAASIVVLAVPAIGMAAATLATARVGVVAVATLFVAILAATVVLGGSAWARSHEGALDRVFSASISERRITLWHEAIGMMTAHQAFGVGPGRFRFESPTARVDPDASWAHNEFLQQGAETGVPGFVALLLLFAWGFARLWSSNQPDAFVVMGAVALAVLGIHACVDYVMHFPAIPVTTAALVGAATAAGRLLTPEIGTR